MQTLKARPTLRSERAKNRQYWLSKAKEMQQTGCCIIELKTEGDFIKWTTLTFKIPKELADKIEGCKFE